MMIISLIFLAFIATGLYFWNKNRAVPTNRYRKVKRVTRTNTINKATKRNKIALTLTEQEEPEALEELEEFDEQQIEPDAETDALGIRSTTIKSTAKPEVSSAAVKSANPQADCLVVLYLMAPEGCVYSGYELLQALLAAGMRYNKKRIFSRHEHKDGRGAVLFHCASATPPGTFDLTQMGSFSCKGLCLFFSCSDVDEPLSTFDALLETIDQLVEDLGGQVLDEKRVLFTKDRMVKYRQQIRQFETAQTTADLFA